MRMTETYLKIAQDCGAQLVDMGNRPIPYGELPESGAAVQVNFYSQYQLEDCIWKATDVLQQKLEAAKQRELELLAVIENIKDAINAAEIHSGMLRIRDALNIEPPQALREHEAKIKNGK